METSTNDSRALLKLIISMLIFGTVGIFRRYIPLSSGMLAFSRGILGGCFLLLIMILRSRTGIRKILALAGSRLPLLIVSGALIGINWMLLFEAYNYTTVAVATLCYYMEPTIVIVASAFLFRERLDAKKLICVAASIVGMIFVSGVLGGVSVASGNMNGIVFGLSAAVFYSSVVIINKFIGSMDVYVKTTVQLFSASLILLPYLMINKDWGAADGMGIIAIVMVLIVGILHTGIAYALYFGSISGLRAQTVALFSYIDPVTALILSAVFLGEPLGLSGLLGALLIIGAAIIAESGG